MSLRIRSNSRRSFLKCGACSVGLAVLTGCRNSETEEARAPVAVALGRVEEFPRGVTVRNVERLVIVHDEQGFGALSLRCTHQECLVRYEGPTTPIECPCHGARFSPEGVVLQGPALVDLPWYQVRITAEGILEVLVGATVPRGTRVAARGA